MVFLAAITILRIIGLYVFDIHFRAHRGVQLPPLLAPATQGAAYLLTAFVLLRVWFPDLSLGPLLATSAVTSLVLGLALQPILGNLFAGIVISLEKPFRLEDWDQGRGRSKAASSRSRGGRPTCGRETTTISLFPTARSPRSTSSTSTTRTRCTWRGSTSGAHYATPPYRVRRALLECVPGVDGALEKPSPDVYVKEFADSAINYELRVWIKDIADVDRIKSELRSRIWESFKRHGISIPFPIRTLEFAPRPKPPPDRPDAHRPAVCRRGHGAGVTVRLSERPLLVGRAASADMQLADAQASKEHARIEWTGAGYAIADLGSSFGTLVNGMQGRPVRPSSDGPHHDWRHRPRL